MKKSLRTANIALNAISKTFATQPSNFKKVLFTLTLVVGSLLGAFAQPTVFYTDATMTAANGFTVTNLRLLLADRGSYRQCIFQSTSTQNSKKWAWSIGTQASPDYSVCFRPYSGTPAAITVNSITMPDPTTNSGGGQGALYNNNGGVDGNLFSLGSNYYTFNIVENGSANSYMSNWQTSYAPNQLASPTYTLSNGFLTLGSALTAGENLMMRYTTNSFTNSTIGKCNGNTNGTIYFLPGFTSSTINNTYYFYNTPRLKSAIDGDVSTYGQQAHDLSSFYLINNSGSNYTSGSISLPVSVTGTTDGNGTLYYMNLGAAIAAINNSIHTGVITVNIIGNTTEYTTCILNPTGTTVGSNTASSYSSITISPSGGAARSITGSGLSGNLLDLNGATNVTIDGLNTGGNSLTIDNPSTSSNATIRFYNDATGNTIQNCTIKGSETNTSAAVIYFNTGTNGNDNNTIQNNNITASGSNYPINGIYSTGVTTNYTDSVKILNNNIYDWVNSGGQDGGVNLAINNAKWRIEGNSFYQTTDKTATSTHSAIYLQTTSTDGFTIRNNYIGGSAAQCGGSAWNTRTPALAPQGYRFCGIQLNFSSSTVFSTSLVSGNTIANMNVPTSSTGSTFGAWTAIGLATGNCTISNNIIGNATASGAVNPSIQLSANGSGTPFFGINVVSGGSGTYSITGNVIAGISIYSTSSALAANASNGCSFYGIGLYSWNTAATNAVTGNVIGSRTVANSIYGGGGGTPITSTVGCSVIGIGVSGTTGTSSTIFNISQDTIANLTNTYNGAASSTGNPIPRTMGIYCGSTYNVSTPAANPSTFTVSNNYIHNLKATSAAAYAGTNASCANGFISVFSSGNASTISSNVLYNHYAANANSTATNSYGIWANLTATSTISKNRIYNMMINPNITAATGEMRGISCHGGTINVMNNMVTLGIDTAFSSATQNKVHIYGLNDATATTNYYNNNVFIRGTLTNAAAVLSAAINCQSGNTNTISNNVLVNTRGSATANTQWCINRASGGTATINYNAYYYPYGATGNCQYHMKSYLGYHG